MLTQEDLENHIRDAVELYSIGHVAPAIIIRELAAEVIRLREGLVQLYEFAKNIHSPRGVRDAVAELLGVGEEEAFYCCEDCEVPLEDTSTYCTACLESYTRGRPIGGVVVAWRMEVRLAP